jgi:hypothetical protein
MVALQEDIDGLSLYAIGKILDGYKKEYRKILASAKRKSKVASVRQLLAMVDEVELAIAAMAESLGYDVAFYAGEAGMRSLAEVENIVSWDGLVDGFNKVAMSSAQMAAMAAATTYSGRKINEWISGIFNAGIDDIKADIKSGSAAASGSAAVLWQLARCLKAKI